MFREKWWKNGSEGAEQFLGGPVFVSEWPSSKPQFRQGCGKGFRTICAPVFAERQSHVFQVTETRLFAPIFAAPCQPSFRTVEFQFLGVLRNTYFDVLPTVAHFPKVRGVFACLDIDRASAQRFPIQV